MLINRYIYIMYYQYTGIDRHDHTLESLVDHILEAQFPLVNVGHLTVK